MSDLTMCANQECKMRETCYRTNAKIGMRQSWCDFKPESDTQCEHRIQFDKQTKQNGK